MTFVEKNTEVLPQEATEGLLPARATWKFTRLHAMKAYKGVLMLKCFSRPKHDVLHSKFIRRGFTNSFNPRRRKDAAL
jgi:hypothetical protein